MAQHDLSATCLAFKQAFATEAGQEVLRYLVGKFGFARYSTFAPGDRDRTMLNEGQRTVMVEIGRMIDADPAQFDRAPAGDAEHQRSSEDGDDPDF